MNRKDLASTNPKMLIGHKTKQNHSACTNI